MSTAATDLREQVAATARRLADEGLLIGTAGNVSARSDDRIAVTGTGVTLARCTADDVTEVSPDGAHLFGDLAPTSELNLHLKLYERNDIRAVVHTHAPFSTAVASVEGLNSLPVVHYQQLLLGGEVRVAPYATFGSARLATNVALALRDRHVALMANHGSVAIGATLEKAIDHALLLEWLAALYQRAGTMGHPRTLTDEQQHAVIAAAVHSNYGTPTERTR